MNNYEQVWHDMGRVDRQILIDRMIKYHKPDLAVLFVKNTIDGGLTYAAGKAILEQRLHITHNLYPSTIPNHSVKRKIQNLHYSTVKRNSYTHIILDVANQYLHINTQKTADMEEVIRRFMNHGKILNQLDLIKDDSIFLYPMYRAYKIIGSTNQIHSN